MKPYRCSNFTPTQEQLTIKIETFNQHYNQLKELNDLYNENQLIYRKYDINKQMAYITALLKSITFMDGHDICATFSQKTEYYIEYVRPESIKFSQSFLTLLDFEYASKHNNITKTLQNLNKKKDNETRLKEYIEKASSELTQLMFKLDELTTYYNGDIPNNLKMRENYFFITAEEHFKRNKK